MIRGVYMEYNDYVIAFDENGTPYIAHAGFMDGARNAVNAAANRVQQVANNVKGVGRGVRQNHKYILKVNENGKTRYFYKQEEVKAYYEAKKQGIKNAAEYAQNAVKNKTATAADAVKDAATKAGTVAKSVAREVTGQAARDRMDAAGAKFPELENRKVKTAGDVLDKQTAYDVAERKANDAAYNYRKAEEALNKSNWLTRRHNQKRYDKANAQLYEAYDEYGKANAEMTKADNAYAQAKKEYNDGERQYNVNKAVYDHSIAGMYDKVAPKAKEAANNAVTKAKAQFDRMKDEFKAKDQQKTESGSSRPHSRDKKVGEGSVRAESGDKVDLGGPVNGSNDRIESTSRSVASDNISKVKPSAKDMIENAKKAISSAKDTAEKARTAAKDASEDLSAKAKSTVQSAKDSVQGMIENARSSTAKAVNEAWDKIPKNADGTVNPFDSNFQSAYNDWKSKKDKYDGSLTGQAKAVAEKATDSVKDMIDKAKKTAKEASQQISDNLDVKQLQKNLERDMKNHGYSLEDAYNQHKDWLKTMQSGQLPDDHKEYYKKMSELEDKAYNELKAKRSAKKYFNEYSDNDSDFAEKNYSKENRVADTDFYTFKRNDGKSVILEEDMKWVLPKGVDAGDPAIKSALKKIANSGNFKSYDDWLENANDILGDAIEKVRDKEK